MKKTLTLLSLLFFIGSFIPQVVAEENLLEIRAVTEQNSVKLGMMFLVSAQVVNQSEDEVSFWANTCSYEKHWVTDNPDVFSQSWTCDENDLEEITLKPDDVYERNIILYVPKKDKTGDVTFRLGFKRMEENGDVSDPLWSEPITMRVIVPEENAPAVSADQAVSQSAAVSAEQKTSVQQSPIRIYQDPEVPIKIHPGEEFMIVLPGNPTTGYEWRMTYPEAEKTLLLLDSKYVPSNTKMLGAPGDQQYKFKALKPGEVKISLIYKRPWEPTVSDTTKIFTVIVQEN